MLLQGYDVLIFVLCVLKLIFVLFHLLGFLICQV